MLSISAQIATEKLICPISRQVLTEKNNRLHTPDGQYSYPLINGVPILLPEDKQVAYLDQAQGSMAKEYARSPRPSRLRQWFTQFVNKDYRSHPSQQAFHEVIGSQPDDALCVAVGGGPIHVHPKLVNLNIGLFPNVHVVGDAYELPYADNSVDAIHCEAVLEHLEYPNEAAVEMFRVLRPGGQLFAATPFMQHFHAYPNHFQNYTLIGHKRLFERAGFGVVSAGVCVGPTYAVSGMVYRYIYTYLAIPVIKHLMAAGAAVLALLLRPLDNRLNQSPQAHLLASTTYAHLIKN